MRDWVPGEHGKAVLVGPLGDPRLVTWVPLAFGGPHHLDVVDALGAGGECRAFLFIAPDGEVTASDGGELDAQAAVDAALSLDERLTASGSAWRFD